MQGSFEKDIQRKMDELRLTPSAPVWEKIEIEIRLEKKRRRGIFWLLFAGLLLAGGGWWGYQALNNEPSQVSHQPMPQALQPPSLPSTVAIGKEPEKKIAHPSGIETREAKKRQKNNPALPGVVKRKSIGITVNRQNKPAKISGWRGGWPGKNNSDPAETATAVKEQRSADKTEVQVLKRNDTNATLLTPVPVSNDTIASQKTDVITTDSVNKAKAPMLSTDTVIKKKVVKVSKWKKELTITIGGSNNTAAPLFGSGAARLYAYANSASSGGGFVQTPLHRAAKATTGFAFSTGFGLGRKLSPKWEVSFGLQYAYYSTHMKVGEKKNADTTVSFNLEKAATSGFYTNAGSTNYTNHFHLLQAPVTVSFQPKTSFPLLVSATVAYGYLLSTNALTFSPTSNLYYQNKANYNRHQVPVTAAVQWRFNMGKNFLVQTGPFVQYNLLKLQQEASASSQHLVFAGVKTGINF